MTGRPGPLEVVVWGIFLAGALAPIVRALEALL